ncbi:hypothetical protein OS493_007398 [Desmophyllum pertusum]|uniref:Uncharacterized protein n=1 Tax=Desmophyllum pertusum TaxID=174260 RepID=A0A9W9Z340_9CNID|nr:hypothetical protein OS493_007398 [Desmophyllum pertusum]
MHVEVGRSLNSPRFLNILGEVSFFLQNHESPEDWAELYYDYGSVWLAYMSMIPDDERNAQARNTARGKARCYYEQAISFCKKDPRLRVQIKSKRTFISVLLKCYSTAVQLPRELVKNPFHPKILKRLKNI